jgi:hypothetical protein
MSASRSSSQATVGATPRQRLSVDQLHHEIRMTVGRDAAVEQETIFGCAKLARI